jgi:signal transduction histidine kinase
VNAPDEHRILILAPLGRDGPLAERVIREAGIDAQVCSSIEHLCEEIEKGAAAALLTEEVLGVPQAREFLALLERQPPWSDLPVIVFGSSAASLGKSANVSLLDRPVRIRTMVSTVRAALRARRRQYEARNLLRDLERSVRDRDQFLAMLGHELRNPLAAILTASELLDAQAEPADEKPRAVIGRQVRHLARLVDDLLDVARVTSGKIALSFTDIDLADVVAKTVQTYDASARGRGVAIAMRRSDGPLLVRADPVRIEQIVGNVLGNAIKYTPSGGRVEVETTSDSSAAVLRVRDTGVGIPEEVLPRVFELFVQAPGTLDRAQGGLGIGLTLVHRLVALHHGTVTARSEGVGKGSEFEVRLPLSRETDVAGAATTERPDVARGTHLVLLAEDNGDARDLLQTALELHGYRVSSCEDGETAVHRALLEKPGTMIIDLGLPRKDGYQVARDVRAAVGREMRLIALTGYGQPDDKVRAADAGFDAFLTKPVELKEILRALTTG